jgi:hypothetical protein
MLNRCHPLARGLALAWIFNEGGSGLASGFFDHAQNHISPTVTGDPQWIPEGIELDGSDSYLIASAFLKFIMSSNKEFSFATKVTTDGSQASDSKLFEMKAGVQTVRLNLDSSEQPQFQIRDAGGTWRLCNSATSLGTAQWGSLVGTNKTSETTLYQDGVQTAQATTSLSDSGIVSDFYFGISADGGARFWDGKVEYFYLWMDRVLTPAEIALLNREPYAMF